MKVMIVGMGSIGKRHAGILLDNFDHSIVAFRTSGVPSGIEGIEEISSWKEVERSRPDVAFITNPTANHIESALRCAKLGMHLFIEKPLSNSLAGIDELKTICDSANLACYTAYCLRFHPVIRKIKELISGKNTYHVRAVCSSFLPDWREDNADSYSRHKDQGGGVILDLSHEFDYLHHLFGTIASIEGWSGRASAVTDDAEDFADVLMKAGNTPVSLHINFFSHIAERSIKTDFEHGYLVGDLLAGTLEYKFEDKSEMFRFDINRNNYLKAQTKYYFENIHNKDMMNGLSEARGILEKVLDFRNA